MIPALLCTLALSSLGYASAVLPNAGSNSLEARGRLPGCCIQYFRDISKKPDSTFWYPWDSEDAGEPEPFSQGITGAGYSCSIHIHQSEQSPADGGCGLWTFSYTANCPSGSTAKVMPDYLCN